MPAYGFNIRLDAARNVVHVAPEGHADGGDLRRMRDAYVQTLQGVRPGWVRRGPAGAHGPLRRVNVSAGFRAQASALR